MLLNLFLSAENLVITRSLRIGHCDDVARFGVTIFLTMLELQDAGCNGPAIVLQERFLTDVVFRRSAPSVVRLRGQQLFHGLAVLDENVTIVCLWSHARGHPPKVRVRVLNPDPFDCYPLGWTGQTRRIIPDELLAKVELANTQEGQQ